MIRFKINKNKVHTIVLCTQICLLIHVLSDNPNPNSRGCEQVRNVQAKGKMLWKHKSNPAQSEPSTKLFECRTKVNLGPMMQPLHQQHIIVFMSPNDK
jgi:hypothetical protein